MASDTRRSSGIQRRVLDFLRLILTAIAEAYRSCAGCRVARATLSSIRGYPESASRECPDYRPAVDI